jgi:hypothetical protein
MSASFAHDLLEYMPLTPTTKLLKKDHFPLPFIDEML